jgi:hypothetical protein
MIVLGCAVVTEEGLTDVPVGGMENTNHIYLKKRATTNRCRRPNKIL